MASNVTRDHHRWTRDITAIKDDMTINLRDDLVTSFDIKSDGIQAPQVNIVGQNQQTAACPILSFLTQRGTNTAGQDDDQTGLIIFKGYNDAGTPERINFAHIEGKIHDATDGEESGKLSLRVASHDGGTEDGLVLTGGSVDAEVDVTIGNGAASMTTIAGNLDIDGDKVTSVGNLEIETGGSGDFLLDVAGDISLNADGGEIFFMDGAATFGHLSTAASVSEFRLYEDGGASTDYFRIRVGAAGNSSIETYDGAGANANLTLDPDGDLIVSGADVTIDSSKSIIFGDVGEYITGDGTDLYIASSNDLLLSVGGTLNIRPVKDVIIDRDVDNTDAGTYIPLDIDFDKVGASTSNNTLTGLRVSLTNTTATNGTNSAHGAIVTAQCSHAADAGTATAVGGQFRAIGGTNGTGTATGLNVISSSADTNNGIVITCDDGGNDLMILSTADTADFFKIKTTTNGATEISTTDGGAALAHLDMIADGNLALACSPAGKIVAVENDGSTYTPNHADSITTKAYVDSVGGTVQVATGTISQAEMNALETTEKEVVAAQGVPQHIIPLSCSLLVDRASTQTANVNLILGYDGSTTLAFGSIRRFMYYEAGDRQIAFTMIPSVEVSNSLVGGADVPLTLKLTSAITTNSLTAVYYHVTYVVWDMS